MKALTHLQNANLARMAAQSAIDAHGAKEAPPADVAHSFMVDMLSDCEDEESDQLYLDFLGVQWPSRWPYFRFVYDRVIRNAQMDERTQPCNS